jgi:hypothetical protein
MFDTYKMQEAVCKELEKKAESGLKSTSDLDTVWKLIDAYKNLLKIDMLQEAGEYSHDDGYDRDHSERRRRDSMGRYSRHDGYDRGSSYNHGAYDRYMDAKHSYRSSRSPEHKKEMSGYLGEYKDELKEIVNGLLAGADTREEREEIKKMIREIGNLA